MGQAIGRGGCQEPPSPHFNLQEQPGQAPQSGKNCGTAAACLHECGTTVSDVGSRVLPLHSTQLRCHRRGPVSTGKEGPRVRQRHTRVETGERSGASSTKRSGDPRRDAAVTCFDSGRAGEDNILGAVVASRQVRRSPTRHRQKNLVLFSPHPSGGGDRHTSGLSSVEIRPHRCTSLQQDLCGAVCGRASATGHDTRTETAVLPRYASCAPSSTSPSWHAQSPTRGSARADGGRSASRADSASDAARDAGRAVSPTQLHPSVTVRRRGVHPNTSLSSAPPNGVVAREEPLPCVVIAGGGAGVEESICATKDKEAQAGQVPIYSTIAGWWTRILEWSPDNDDISPFQIDEIFMPSSAHPGPTIFVSTADGRRVKLRPTRRVKSNLPLAGVVGPNLNVAKIRADAISLDLPKADELLTLLDLVVTDCKLLENMKDTPEPIPDQFVARNWLPFDLSMMLESSVVDEFRGRGIFGKAFKVPKDDDVSRFILDCRLLNSLVESPNIDMGLPRIHEIMDELLQGPWRHVTSIDATSFFYQIPLHPRIRRLFCFKAGCRRGFFKKYCMCALPMGFTLAPVIAQHIAQFICNVFLQRMPNVFCKPWVDNFIIATTTQGSLHAAKQVFSSILTEYGLVCKPFDDSGNLLGLHFNLIGDKSVSLAADFTTKLEERLSQINAESMSEREFLQLAGGITYMNYTVVRSPLCFSPALLAELFRVSKMVATHGMDDGRVFVPSALLHSELEMWLAVVRECPTLYASQLVRPPITQTLWTDSSTQALAVVDERPQSDVCTIFRAPCPCDSRQIFLCETLAVILGQLQFARPESHARICTDSRILFFTLTKGHSMCPLLNEMIRDILSTDWFQEVTWVPTKEQRADPLTRDQFRPHPRAPLSVPAQWHHSKWFIHRS